MRRGEIEAELIEQGLSIIGVDEVGRGCLAGPVFAACAVLDYKRLHKLPKKKKLLIRDSKKLSSGQRATILCDIRKITVELHTSSAGVREIEALGIVEATFLAMQRALAKCQERYGMLLVDGNRPLTGYSGLQKTVVSGDDLCYAIAAASIYAKETRDVFMREQAQLYPGYGFETNVGYGTQAHLDAIREKGICPLHRKNFAPITNFSMERFFEFPTA